MPRFDIASYTCILLILSWFRSANCYSESRQAVMTGEATPQLSQIRDSRIDGITYEAHLAMITLHLKEVYHGKTLEDFTFPGRQELKIEHGHDEESKRSDMFLQVLETLKLSPESAWEVDITGDGTYAGNRTLMLNVFRRLPAITSIHWRNDEFIPPNVLRFLEANHPSCRLYYDLNLWARDSSDEESRKPGGLRRKMQQQMKIVDNATPKQSPPLLREAILNSTNLYSLTVEVINGGRQRHPWRMDLILSILTTCPNIKELDIKVSRTGGCVQFSTNDPYGFDFTTSNATLPPLESLTIDGYHFHDKPNGQNWMEWEAENPEPHILKVPWKYAPASVVEYFGYPKIQSWGGLESSFVKRDTSALPPGTKTNLDIWLERMDWTHLRTLKIENPSSEDLEKFRGDILPGLRHVWFSGYYANHHAILDYLGNISSTLEDIQFDGINFCNLSEAINTIVSHHGSSLHTMVIKHPQPQGSWYYSTQNHAPYRYPITSFLTAAHLVQLRDNISSLRTLDLDVFVSEEWDYELLDTLASFPELEDLTLRFEEENNTYDYENEIINYMGEDDYRGNGNKIALMEGLKVYVKKRKVGKQLKKLETWVGPNVVKDIRDIC